MNQCLVNCFITYAAIVDTVGLRDRVCGTAIQESDIICYAIIPFLEDLLA